MIRRFHKARNLSPREGETPICGNEMSIPSSASELVDISEAPVEEQIMYLADLLIEGLLWHYEHGAEQQQKEGSDLLPSINKRTG